jgi:hypothetical protein
MTLHHACLSTVFLLATSVMGRAECLTPADLDSGIRVTFANSDWTEIRRIDAEQFDVYEYYANAGYGHRYTAHQGLVPQEGIRSYQPNDDDGSTRYWRDFSVDPSQMANLAKPGSGGAFTFIETYTDGTKLNNDLTIIVSEAPTVDVPGCSYAATMVEIREEWANPVPDNVVTWSFYLSDLGVAVLFAAKTMNGNLVSSPPVSIERLDGT